MKRCLLATAALALLIPSGLAKANTYDVYSCWAGFGTFRNPNASSAAWTKDQTHAGGHFTAADDCATNITSGSMSVQSVNGAPATQNQYADLTFTAPTGTSLAGATLWRAAWNYGSGTQRNALTTLTDGTLLTSDADGTADVPFGTRGSGSTTNHGIVSSNIRTLNLTGRNASKLIYRAGCGVAAGCPTASPSGPLPDYAATGVRIFGSIVSINDPAPPNLLLAQGGLLGADPVSGTRPLTVQAAIDGSGIRELAVYADDEPGPIGDLDYEQDVNRCDWTLAVPCQNVQDTDIPVDTTRLRDGVHSIVVRAFDAAGNEATSSTRYITVKNTPPDQPTPAPTDPGGGGDDPGHDPDPGPGGADPGGNGLPNGVPSDGGGTVPVGDRPPTLAVTFDHNGKSKLTAKYGRIVWLRGRLRDGRGGAIANAQVGYSALSAKAGARVQSLGSVRTDSDGVFTLSVATKLGSRQLRFAYSPQLGGPAAVSTQARLDVVAPITLKARPKLVHNWHSVTFRGRLLAGPMPRKGKLVNLQVVVDGHWHTFATVRSFKSGKYKYRYRFTRSFGLVTYRFRALSRYEAAYPFVAGHSKTVKVSVTSCPIACE